MRDPSYFRELTEDLGYNAVPVTVVGGEVVLGFDRGKLESLL